MKLFDLGLYRKNSILTCRLGDKKYAYFYVIGDDIVAFTFLIDEDKLDTLNDEEDKLNIFEIEVNGQMINPVPNSGEKIEKLKKITSPSGNDEPFDSSDQYSDEPVIIEDKDLSKLKKFSDGLALKNNNGIIEYKFLIGDNVVVLYFRENQLIEAKTVFKKSETVFETGKLETHEIVTDLPLKNKEAIKMVISYLISALEYLNKDQKEEEHSKDNGSSDNHSFDLFGLDGSLDSDDPFGLGDSFGSQTSAKFVKPVTKPDPKKKKSKGILGFFKRHEIKSVRNKPSLSEVQSQESDDQTEWGTPSVDGAVRTPENTIVPPPMSDSEPEEIFPKTVAPHPSDSEPEEIFPKTLAPSPVDIDSNSHIKKSSLHLNNCASFGRDGDMVTESYFLAIGERFGSSIVVTITYNEKTDDILEVKINGKKMALNNESIDILNDILDVFIKESVLDKNSNYSK